jgi:acetoacetate decarboxylase
MMNQSPAKNHKEMDYPPAPWRLRGHALAAFRFIELATARLFIRNDIPLVAVVPGKTLAGLALIDYGIGSTLNYQELIVFPGLVRHKARPGIWVSHIYVNNLTSLKGGREMFGVPKEMAAFDWRLGRKNQVRVSQDGQTLVEVKSRKAEFNLRVPFWGAAFGDAAGDLRRFIWKSTAQGWLAKAELKIPLQSPFSLLGLDIPHAVVEINEIEAWLGGIQILTQDNS